MKTKAPLPETTVRAAHEDYYLRDMSWRVLEARYGILHGSLYNAFKRLGLRLRSAADAAGDLRWSDEKTAEMSERGFFAEHPPAENSPSDMAAAGGLPPLSAPKSDSGGGR